MKKNAHLRLGTAGWNVPAACHDQVGGDGSHLARYARVMNAVEINTSFYKAHRRQTYEKWATTTPVDFRFSVKVPKIITHSDDNTLSDIARFVDETSGLGAKLAVYLVQFPPSKAFDEKAAALLFGQLQSSTRTSLVCEPRHASWFSDDVDRWLTEQKISRVAADPARIDGVDAPGGWAGIRYFRLHGSPRIYYSSYDDAYLRDLKLRVTDAASRRDVWCIFDNTASGAALENVLRLRRSLTDRA